MNDELECPHCGSLFSDSEVRDNQCPRCGRVMFNASGVVLVLMVVAIAGYFVMRGMWQ